MKKILILLFLIPIITIAQRGGGYGGISLNSKKINHHILEVYGKILTLKLVKD